ncbi:MAG: type II secretion system protein [Roseimicrobium sp.]
MKIRRRRLEPTQGFTLIELLVVISIIALLATMGVAGGQMVIKKARELDAKTAMKGLEIAIKGYKTEYLRLPSPDDSPTDDNEAFDTGDETGMGLIEILMGTNTAKNPRRVPFYEPKPGKSGSSGYSTEGGLRDPWGNGYKVVMDYGADGRISNPYAGGDSEPEEVPTDVIIYSAGANKIFEEGGSGTGKKLDDLRSWQ